MSVPDRIAPLERGPLFRFADWPSPVVPQVAAGVYTVWLDGDLVYVGMSGRGWTADDIARRIERGEQKKGLWSRLNSHASGRRSGDQFCVYVCDRYVVPTLTADEMRALGQGQGSLDNKTREFIHQHLAYRFVVVKDGATALRVEWEVQAGALAAGRPALNPR